MKKIYKIACYVSILFCLTAIACKKKKEPEQPMETGTVTDVENNTYKTVKIGNQWWMAENLKVKKYRNGKPLIQIYPTDPNSAWAQEKRGAYCTLDNNTSNTSIYGFLYNWYTVNDSNQIAPDGWHVPSDEEWKTLEKYLGMSPANADKVNWRGENEADKLKVASPGGWTQYGSIWSTNESGFSALAGCCRLFNGIWGSPLYNAQGFWWSSSLHSTNDEAWYRNLDYKKNNVFRYYAPKSYGMSIRCVKD